MRGNPLKVQYLKEETERMKRDGTIPTTVTPRVATVTGGKCGGCGKSPEPIKVERPKT